MSTANGTIRRFTDLRLLSLAVGLVIVLDVATTFYGLSIGLPEGNPFVRSILETYGLLGFVVLKGIAVLWCGILYKALGAKYGKAALLGLFIPQAIAVILNLITIVQA